MADYSPVKFEVAWDDQDLELRLMKALHELVQRAGTEGLTSDSQARAVTWLKERFGTGASDAG